MSVGRSLNDRNNNPVNFFPPILKDAVEEIERELQAPVELIETVVLAAVSLDWPHESPDSWYHLN